MTGFKKLAIFNETLKFLRFLGPIETLTISSNQFWTGLIIPNLPNPTISNFQASESENQEISKFGKRAPGNDRDLSDQMCFNFRGVLIGEKPDAWIFDASKHQAANIRKLDSKTLARS